MKVKELIEKLKVIDGELEIYLQKDAEGNGYESLYYVYDRGIIIDECGDINIYQRDWTADQACIDEEEWEQIKQDESRYCVVLAP